ncbi:hypothetical protein HYE82_02505 [Streptomyces sp. BR123]|uniref:hypothetical protein n=1 Tax=Streptomyces sp. BR123 TaxID=2749828 RepID=UPI0015C4546F|nr:hypothetical protein [Streptomyces sp. BR123]NXY93300.1 hypothetical protein [Streptomyces sp. BR123]
MGHGQDGGRLGQQQGTTRPVGVLVGRFGQRDRRQVQGQDEEQTEEQPDVPTEDGVRLARGGPGEADIAPVGLLPPHADAQQR